MPRREVEKQREKSESAPYEVLCASVEGLRGAALDLGERRGDERIVAMPSLGSGRTHGAQDGGGRLQDPRRQALKDLLVDAAAENGLVLIGDVQLQESNAVSDVSDTLRNAKKKQNQKT